MDTRLLDAAYHLSKQAEFGPYPEKLVARLQADFASIDGATAAEAHSCAKTLIAAACQWAEERRGPKNDGSGSPSFKLSDRCPGFSAGVYSDAEAWGLYLTK
jgi:hypothetical protein